MHIFWARLASFSHFGPISDPLIVLKSHNETHDPKGQENKMYIIVKCRETFYRRHTIPVTSNINKEIINTRKCHNHTLQTNLRERDEANSFDTDAPFLDLNLSITNGIVSSKINDKRDDFNFEIVNFPFLDGDVARSPSNGVYISQLIRFARLMTLTKETYFNLLRY